MNRNYDTNPQLQFNGGDLEAEEARLLAEGVDVQDDDTPAALAAKPGDAAQPDPPAATVDTPAAPEVLAIPDAPAAPKDFEAAAAELEQKYDDGNMTILELQKEMRKLTLEEVDHKNALAAWEREKAGIEAKNQANVQSAEDAEETAWKNAAVSFEAAHSDFLGNKVRHAMMQAAINDVLATGVQMTHAKVLEEAYAIAKGKSGYVEPAGNGKPTREQVADAAKGRGGNAMQSLGDMPTSMVESVRGNADFASLDALPIDQLEVAVANMRPEQLEKFLRDAPGANATGHE